MMLAKIRHFVANERLLLAQNREIKRLRAEVEGLRLENEKINRAMRRCLTCEYRLEFVSRD